MDDRRSPLAVMHRIRLIGRLVPHYSLTRAYVQSATSPVRTEAAEALQAARMRRQALLDRSRSPTFEVSRGGGLNEGSTDLPDSPAPVAQERLRVPDRVDLRTLQKEQSRFGKRRGRAFQIGHSPVVR